MDFLKQEIEKKRKELQENQALVNLLILLSASQIELKYNVYFLFKKKGRRQKIFQTRRSGTKTGRNAATAKSCRSTRESFG